MSQHEKTFFPLSIANKERNFSLKKRLTAENFLGFKNVTDSQDDAHN
jgi:hypothetical protein